MRKHELNKPVDFLKIGHHGSINATPWNDKEDGTVTEPSTILDAILPLPKGNAKPKAKAVVSTERTPYEVIPRADSPHRNRQTRQQHQDSTWPK